MNKLVLDRVIHEKDHILLNVNPRVYPSQAVIRTAENFQNICRIKIVFEPKKGTCENIKILIFPKKGIDPESVGYEFYNHLLNSLKNMKTKI